MADVSHIVHRQGAGQNVTDLKKYACVEAVVSKDDTITISHFTTIEAAHGYALDNADEISLSVANNVVTILEDPATDERAIFLIIGT